MKIRKSVILAGVLMVLVCFLFASLSDAGWIRGYYRSNGTYVRPHYRTNPDGNPYNNYSFPGNYNPNTGRITPGNPDTYLERYYNPSRQRTYESPRIYYWPRNYYQRSLETYDND